MKKLTIEEAKKIKGGSLSGAVVNAFIGCFNTFADIGRALGSSIRRLVSKNLCM